MLQLMGVEIDRNYNYTRNAIDENGDKYEIILTPKTATTGFQCTIGRLYRYQYYSDVVHKTLLVDRCWGNSWNDRKNGLVIKDLIRIYNEGVENGNERW